MAGPTFTQTGPCSGAQFVIALVLFKEKSQNNTPAKWADIPGSQFQSTNVSADLEQRDCAFLCHIKFEKCVMSLEQDLSS